MNTPGPSSDLVERDFRASLDAVLPWRMRLAAFTCLGGNGAFAAIDAMTLVGQPMHTRVLVRALFTPAFLVLAWFASSRFGRARPQLAVLALSAVLAVELGILGAQLAPAESVGFFPAMLFFTVFLPLPKPRAALMAILLLLGFLIPQLLWGIGPLGLIIKHAGNLLATGAISLVASHMAETMARREFVAQRRLAETGARLEALAHAKDRFFGEVSTELRTPLTAALLALETSRLGESEHAPIARPLQRMQKLVDELLALSRVDTGAAHGSATDVAAAARRMVDEFQGAFAFRGLSLQAKVAEGTLPVRVGAEALGRILASLLGRALESVPRGGSITVQVRAEDALAVVQVTDDGPAITPAELPRVFDRFAQVTGAGEEDTGIALAVARSLTELHQGQLECVSQSAGTSFVLRFPLARSEAVLEPLTARLDEQVEGAVAAALDGTEVLGLVPGNDAPLSAPLALVIEDHLDLAARLQASLSSIVRVHLLAGATGALDLVRTLQPELVVAEAVLQSGAAAGLTLARQLREDPSTRATPLLLLSALTDREHVLAALQAGADDVLAKPFDGAMVRARVEGLLRLKKKRDEAQQAQSLLRALCERFALALHWDSLVLLSPGANQTLAPLAWGGKEPPEGSWGALDAPWLLGAPRPLISDGRALEPAPAALARQRSAALAPLDAAQEPGALVGFSTETRVIDARALEGLRAAALSVGALLDHERRAGALVQMAEERRRLSSAVVTSQDAERRRLALELHDGPGQVLVGALLHLDLEQKRNTGSESLQASRDLVHQALAEIRSFSHDLHPPTLTQHGLKRTLQSLAGQLTSERPRVVPEIAANVPDVLPSQLALTLFRIAQTALGNSIRHANARTIHLRLFVQASELVLEVEDDGEGFLPGRVSHGVGLLGMRQRAESCGGTLALDSDLGGGTRMRCVVPLRG